MEFITVEVGYAFRASLISNIKVFSVSQPGLENRD
jgi:hypothetical protein